jgi:hypothetical protein
VVFEKCVLKLFDHSEELRVLRSDLLKTLDSIREKSERLQIVLFIKIVDLMRIMFLHEYELLDTSHIIQKDYMSSYYARRMEILIMTKAQISGHLKELEDLRDQISYPQALDCIDRAGGILSSSLQIVQDTIEVLENRIVASGMKRTKH